jgi:SAM-dependent methyltransferase
MKNSDLLDQYFSLVRKRGLFSKHLRHYLNILFDNISFDNKRVLDIGGGAGLFSFYAACMGAQSVVCLEPEAEGSSPGIKEDFNFFQSNLSNIQQVELKATILQNYRPINDQKFDIVLLHNSINHLDENACINLRRDRRAINIYEGLFRNLSNLINKGGKIIIVDSSRLNFFALCGLKNPFAPTIEWQKHQQPKYWAKLLSNCGFTNPCINWLSFNRLGAIGKFFLGNMFASFFLNSYFCLKMEKK